MEFIGTGSESRESMNIYCDKKTDRIQPFVLILIMAHYDSIGHSISYTRTKRNLIYVLVFGTLSLLFHLILSLRIFMDSNLILLYFAGLAIMFYLLTVLFLNHLKKIKVSNISPGGTDNASGVAICLNLIRYFEKINLSWCDLRFLFPAAEEFGLFGSKSHQTLHKGEFDRYLKTYIINIDTITDILCYQTFNTKKNNKTHNIEDIIKNVATSTKITLKKASQLIGGSDHIPFCKEGYESAFFFGQNHEFIHSEADTIDKITPKNVSDTLELIYRVILEIDRRASFIIESGSKKF